MNHRCVESQLISHSVSVMFRMTLFLLNILYVAICKRISSGGVLAFFVAFSFYVDASAGIFLVSVVFPIFFTLPESDRQVF